MINLIEELQKARCLLVMWSLMVSVFDPRKITKWTDQGIVYPHGDHFHFIPYSSLSPLERELARQFQLLRAKGSSSPTEVSPSLPSNPSTNQLILIMSMATVTSTKRSTIMASTQTRSSARTRTVTWSPATMPHFYV